MNYFNYDNFTNTVFMASINLSKEQLSSRQQQVSLLVLLINNVVASSLLFCLLSSFYSLPFSNFIVLVFIFSYLLFPSSFFFLSYIFFAFCLVFIFSLCFVNPSYTKPKFKAVKTIFFILKKLKCKIYELL